MPERVAPATRPPDRRPIAAQPLYVPLDRPLVRTPLLSIDTYHALRGEQDSGAGRPDSLVPADPRILAALAVGSIDLLEALERTPPSSRDADRLRGKLLRFLIRMATRPTPYGLFAGVALAEWGPYTDLAVAEAPPRKRTRPDMDWLLHLALELETRPEVLAHLRLATNPMAVVRADRVLLMERAASTQPDPAPAVSIRATGVVRRALDQAREPLPYLDLVAHLLDTTPGATVEQVERLVGDLLQHTLLLTDLRPPLTTDSPARYVLRRLAAIPATREVAARLGSVLDAAAAWDALPLEDERGIGAYRRLVAQAQAIARAPSGVPVQVDLALPLSGRHIHEAVGREVASAAELLLRLSPSPDGPSALAAYRRSFISRYGQGREVPLLELLDAGAGLGSPWAYGGTLSTIPAARAALRTRTLLGLAYGALNDHRRAIELDADTIARLETWSPAPATAPPSLDIYAFVAAASPAALDAGEFEICIGPNVGSQAAGRNLGRFGELLGGEATDALRDAAAAEEAVMSNRRWAELVYVPHQFRSANVMVRPAVRSHEIPVGAGAGVPSLRVIRLNELMVGVCDHRFYVRWPVEDIEVVACSGHMLNYAGAPLPYRFLFEASRDGLAQLGSFDWGPASRFPFLPRVQTGRVVLRPAQWRIDAPTRASELQPDPAADFLSKLGAWRTRWRVPRHVYLAIADNRLLLDLEDPRQAGELRTEVRNLRDDETILLQEVLPGLDQLWVAGPNGRMMAELVVSLVRRGAASESSQGKEDAAPLRRALPAAGEGVSPADCWRPPGSEWLYIKLYGPREREDDLVSGPVRAFAEDAMAASLATAWFFVRYSDPQPHFRLRFRGDPASLIRRLVPALCAWGAELMAEGRCLRFAFDSYEREVERYGGVEGVEAAEALFAADSRAVADLLALESGRGLEIDRLTLAILSVDDLLVGLGMPVAARLEWYASSVEARNAVGVEYRQRKALLRPLLGDPLSLRSRQGGEAVGEVLAARRAALAPVATRLATLEAAGTLGQDLTVLSRSYVHMHCNRLLGAGASVERRVIGLLARTWEGLVRPRKGHRPIV